MSEILALALPPSDPDRTEEKAASYLLGLAALERGNIDVASQELESMASKGGFEYAIYEAGLARLKYAQGDFETAEQIAAELTNPRLIDANRLDLEPDRTRAILLHAQSLAALGRMADARAKSRQFLTRFAAAGEESPDIVLARTLLSAE